MFELREDGQELSVTFEERDVYVKEALLARLKESETQSAAVRRGIAKIVPIALINQLTHQELAMWVCGKAEVDIDLLMRHTKYGGDQTSMNEKSDVVRFFWEVLREMSHADRLKFVKFAWAQERLPANDEEFERTQTRFMIKPSVAGHKDGALPKADTCFFNLELPFYSSKEVRRTTGVGYRTCRS